MGNLLFSYKNSCIWGLSLLSLGTNTAGQSPTPQLTRSSIGVTLANFIGAMLSTFCSSHPFSSPIRPGHGRPASAHRTPVLRSAVAVAGLLFILVCPASTDASTPPRNVLILLAGEYGLPAYDLILHEIRDAVRTGDPGALNWYAEYMDTARFPTVQDEQAAVAFYRQKYQDLTIDLVIAVGPTLEPVFERLGDELFRDTPTLAVDIVAPNAALPTAFQRTRMTGVLPSVDVRATIEAMLTLQPEIERLVIVSGTSDLDRMLDAQVRSACRRYEERMAVRQLIGMSMTEVLAAVEALPRHSAVLFTSFQVDSTGVAYYTQEATRMVAARSSAPVYVLFETNSGVGGVGGHIISFRRVGTAAGAFVSRLLQGEDPATIPPLRDGLHQYQFDWRQLRRWGISEDRLPEGSVLIHREVTFLEKHLWLVMGVAAFIILQAGLITYLVILNRRQKTMSAQVREAEGRYRELLRIERSARLGEMAGSLAHELNQPLTAVLSSAQAGLRFLKTDRMEPDLLREILTNIIKDDKRAASIIRGMRSMLKKEAPDFERLDVNHTVAEVVAIFQGEAIARRTQVETDLDHALPPVMAIKNQLLQVFLNLLLNAAQAMASKRGDDRRVVLATRFKGSNVVMRVRDIGTGIAHDGIDHLFEPFYTTKAKGIGMGLAVCRSIVEDHGGRIRAENNPDRGATFTIELPAVTNG